MAKRRLTNIRVKEVSLVDEAANNKKFIIVKRKGSTMAGKKNADLLKKGDEDLILKMSADVKESLKTQGEEIIEKAKAVLVKVAEVEVSKEAGDEVPSSIIEEFEVIAKSLPKFDNEEDAEDFGIAEIAEEIEKAGKKISSTRLEKINQAFTILSKLLDELSDNGGSSKTVSTSKSNNVKGGSMTTEKKRSPEVELVLAEAEVIKFREALTTAEESADAELAKSAKEGLVKAEADLKIIKDAKETSENEDKIAKAQEAADKAAVALKKAKGEEIKTDENAEILKSIVEGQKLINERLDKAAKDQDAAKEELANIAKTANPSNANDSEEDVNKSKDGKVEKKFDKSFWGSTI